MNSQNKKSEGFVVNLKWIFICIILLLNLQSLQAEDLVNQTSSSEINRVKKFEMTKAINGAGQYYPAIAINNNSKITAKPKNCFENCL